MSQDHPNIVVIPPLALLVAVAASFALKAFFPLPVLPPFPWGAGLVLGVPLMIGAFWVNFAGAGRFLAEGTPINPYKPVQKIVASGVYRFTRNPMYLGMLAALIALGFIFSNAWVLPAAIILFAIFHWGVVLREEAYLKKKFGAPYEDYLRKTRRWI